MQLWVDTIFEYCIRNEFKRIVREEVSDCTLQKQERGGKVDFSEERKPSF